MTQVSYYFAEECSPRYGLYVLAADYARLEQECERLRGDLALALKVPSVAAMHSYLDTECAKQNIELAASRDAALKQVEGLRELAEQANVNCRNTAYYLSKYRPDLSSICSGWCNAIDSTLSAKP